MTLKDKTGTTIITGGILLLIMCLIALEIWQERILIHVILALSLIVLGTITMVYPDSDEKMEVK